ncbi:urea transport system permease protein [Bradyrhizobium sp. LM2.9]
MFKLLEGPQTLGRGKIFWSCFLAVLAGALTYPLFADSYDVGNFAYFLIWIFMALGLCLMWGYGGMLSFGQTLFFGIAGYGYGVLAINMGGGTATIAALVLSVVLAMLAAGILGYFMIWGGINGIFFGIVTLSATLVLAFFLGQTAGPEWHIGPARLNGFNGMKGMDPLTVGDFYIEGSALYYTMIALIVIVYLALRMLVNSGIGNVIVATRENPQRAEMLGYDVRKYQLLTFVIGSGLAGLSGALYTSWGQIYHALQYRPAGSRDADRVGGLLRAKRSDGDPGRVVPVAVRLSDNHGLQPAGRAGADGRAAARHGDAGAAGFCARNWQACRRLVGWAPTAR